MYTSTEEDFSYAFAGAWILLSRFPSVSVNCELYTGDVVGFTVRGPLEGTDRRRHICFNSTTITVCHRSHQLQTLARKKHRFYQFGC